MATRRIMEEKLSLTFQEIEQAVFPTLSAKLRKDYEIAEPLEGPALRDRLFAILQQDVVDWDASKITNETIFKAAFLAIASNMRRWTKFRTTRSEAEGLLAGLDPTAVAKEIARDEGNRLSQKLAQLLGGQTARRDAKAILKWANLLTENKHWADRLTRLRADIEASASPRRLTLSGPEVTIAVAICLGNPSAAMEITYGGNLKVPGMRVALASEFLELRNH
jgi:hypothetical protein